jgi:hypothetical protein
MAKRTAEEQARYMRDYRARKANAKADGQQPMALPAAEGEHPSVSRIAALETENAALVEEVRRLKTLLADRHAPAAPSVRGIPFAGAARQTGGLESIFADNPIRTMAQAERDAILRKVAPARGRRRT